MLTVGSLFSGIGGFELGLERTGYFKTIWQCENARFPSAVLRKHWPGILNLGDITCIDFRKVQRPDVLCGGFPCQDISIAGKGLGIKKGKKSKLWSYFAKAIRILRPKYALIENVPMLTNRGLNVVLADLAKIGYDAQWGCISACEVGAPHRRERIFIIAYPMRLGFKRDLFQRIEQKRKEKRNMLILEGLSIVKEQQMADKESHWNNQLAESLVCGISDGIPFRTHRLEALGNAIVPQVAQVVGEMIKEMDTEIRGGLTEESQIKV